MNKILLFLLISLISFSLSPDVVAQESGGIKWMTLPEVEAAMKKKPKKIVIDIYTDWCGWCKRLDATTYKDAKVVEYINKYYYAVKLDAEMKTPVTYRGKEYKYEGRINTVSSQFMQGSGGYPTITFVNEKFEVINVIPGYQDANNFLKTVKYYGDNYYLNTDFETYLSTIANKL